MSDSDDDIENNNNGRDNQNEFQFPQNADYQYSEYDVPAEGVPPAQARRAHRPYQPRVRRAVTEWWHNINGNDEVYQRPVLNARTFTRLLKTQQNKCYSNLQFSQFQIYCDTTLADAQQSVEQGRIKWPILVRFFDAHHIPGFALVFDQNAESYRYHGSAYFVGWKIPYWMNWQSFLLPDSEKRKLAIYWIGRNRLLYDLQPFQRISTLLNTFYPMPDTVFVHENNPEQPLPIRQLESATRVIDLSQPNAEQLFNTMKQEGKITARWVLTAEGQHIAVQGTIGEPLLAPAIAPDDEITLDEYVGGIEKDRATDPTWSEEEPYVQQPYVSPDVSEIRFPPVQIIKTKSGEETFKYLKENNLIPGLNENSETTRQEWLYQFPEQFVFPMTGGKGADLARNKNIPLSFFHSNRPQYDPWLEANDGQNNGSGVAWKDTYAQNPRTRERINNKENLESYLDSIHKDEVARIVQNFYNRYLMILTAPNDSQLRLILSQNVEPNRLEQMLQQINEARDMLRSQYRQQLEEELESMRNALGRNAQQQNEIRNLQRQLAQEDIDPQVYEDEAKQTALRLMHDILYKPIPESLIRYNSRPYRVSRFTT